MSFSIYYPIFRLKHDYNGVFIDIKFLGNTMKPHPLIIRFDTGVSLLLEFYLSIKTILLKKAENEKVKGLRKGDVKGDSGKRPRFEGYFEEASV